MNAGAAATHPARERAYLDRQIDWAITLADDIATGKYRLVENLHTPHECYVANHPDLGTMLADVARAARRHARAHA